MKHGNRNTRLWKSAVVASFVILTVVPGLGPSAQSAKGSGYEFTGTGNAHYGAFDYAVAGSWNDGDGCGNGDDDTMEGDFVVGAQKFHFRILEHCGNEHNDCWISQLTDDVVTDQWAADHADVEPGSDSGIEYTNFHCYEERQGDPDHWDLILSGTIAQDAGASTAVEVLFAAPPSQEA